MFKLYVALGSTPSPLWGETFDSFDDSVNRVVSLIGFNQGKQLVYRENVIYYARHNAAGMPDVIAVKVGFPLRKLREIIASFES